MDDDLRIIQRVLGGDADAFRLLVQRHQGPLLSMVGNLVRTTADRDDIAQDAFLAAYMHLASYDSREGRFSTWLLTIARNKCYTALKRQTPLTMPSLPPKADPHTPTDALMAREVWDQLDRALAALPFEQRAAFVLAEIEGLSHDEISRIEAAPLGTIKSRISRAKEKLRSLLRSTQEPG